MPYPSIDPQLDGVIGAMADRMKGPGLGLSPNVSGPPGTGQGAASAPPNPSMSPNTASDGGSAIPKNFNIPINPGAHSPPPISPGQLDQLYRSLTGIPGYGA